MTVRPGTVYLVGAGPGDPGLITVRGLELLQRAEVILYDRLVAERLLESAAPSALLIDVGKTPRGPAFDQAAIHSLLIAHARERRIVVRLKGGDPLIFGRGWEEFEACRSAGIPCEIIPGISSALAGPASAGIPVTCRGIASNVMILAAPVSSDRQFQAAALADTCVFLMGMHELPELAERLIANGRDPDTPAAVVERATLPDQIVVRATLATIAAVAMEAGLSSPAIIVVGATAALAAPAVGPLAGRRILVTRPMNAAHELVNQLRGLGAEVFIAPLIQITLSDIVNPTIIDRLSDFDWIVFTSRHGVRGFRRGIEKFGGDVRRFGNTKFAAVGPVTARELEIWGIRPDLQPHSARADALVELLLSQPTKPRRVLFPCGTLALDTLPVALSANGIEVERLIVYQTAQLPLAARTRQGIERGVDAVLLTSPSAVSALGQSGVQLNGAVVVCIGPTTAAATRPFGWPDVRVADVHSDAGLIETILSSLHTEVFR